MNVLHVVASDAFAGTERHVARLARAQGDAGHGVVVIGGSHAEMTRGVAGAGGVDGPSAGLAQTVRALRRLAGGADVVHVHMTTAEVAATLAGTFPGTRLPPVVTTRHFARVRGRGRARAVTAAVARHCVRAQIAISAFTQERIDGESVVVYAGVDPRPDAAHSAQRGHEILMLQRLEAEKDTNAGLRMFASSGLASAGWTLTVAGDGALRSDLEALAQKLGIGGATTFVGQVADSNAHLERAAILLAPARGEHFGLSVLEAMASGLPVVADGSGGHLESLGDAATAWIYPSGDVEGAADRLRALAEAPDLRDRYGTALQQRQREVFTMERQVAETDAVYRSVLA